MCSRPIRAGSDCARLDATGFTTCGPAAQVQPSAEKDLLHRGLAARLRAETGAFQERGLSEIVDWIERYARKISPRKNDQDGLDACLCLLVALHLIEGKDCLMVGDCETGYIVVPDDADLRAELDNRCKQTNRVPSDWVRVFRLLVRAP